MASVRFIAVAIFVALIASSAAADVADDFWDLAEFEMKDKRGVNVFEPNSATATATPNPTDVFTTRFSSLSDVFTTAVPTATPTSVIEASSTAESSVAASSAAASETASLGPSENVTPSSEATSLVFTDFTFTSVVESSAFTAFTPEPTATITLFPTSSFTPIETEVPNTSTPAPIQTSTEQSLPSSSSRFDPKSSIVSQSSVNTPVATTTSTVQATATTGAPRPRPTTVDGYTAEQLAQAVKVSLRGIKTSQFKGGPMETAFKQEVAKAANQALSRLRKRAVTIVISEDDIVILRYTDTATGLDLTMLIAAYNPDGSPFIISAALVAGAVTSSISALAALGLDVSGVVAAPIDPNNPDGNNPTPIPPIFGSSSSSKSMAWVAGPVIGGVVVIGAVVGGSLYYKKTRTGTYNLERIRIPTDDKAGTAGTHTARRESDVDVEAHHAESSSLPGVIEPPGEAMAMSTVNDWNGATA